MAYRYTFTIILASNKLTANEMPECQFFSSPVVSRYQSKISSAILGASLSANVGEYAWRRSQVTTCGSSPGDLPNDATSTVVPMGNPISVQWDTSEKRPTAPVFSNCRSRSPPLKYSKESKSCQLSNSKIFRKDACFTFKVHRDRIAIIAPLYPILGINIRDQVE